MDLNGDGHVDILSGSYSRHDPNMAGLFQVLWGTEDAGFRPAEPLNGSDGEPLIVSRSIDPGDDILWDRVCTRPTACDLNGDGNLDLVTGNIEGGFHLFLGKEGGTFDPESTELRRKDGRALKVSGHSDPFLIDWDSDGDLDLLSGGQTSVFISRNVGTPGKPVFQAFETLVETRTYRGSDEELTFGHGHIEGPRGHHRVCAADVTGDGVLDLLVGDDGTLTYLLDGKTEEETRTAYAQWQAQSEALYDERPKTRSSEDDTSEYDAWYERYRAHQDALSQIVDHGDRGMVWLYPGSIEGSPVVDAGAPR